MVTLAVGVNSWTTVAYADTYFSEKYGASAWATLSSDVKKQLLITAFKWIRAQSDFSIALTANADIVMQAQCEAAWFLYKYQEDYEERRALSASGVKSYKILDVAETLGDVVFPSFIAGMLSDFSMEIQSAFPRVHRDLENGNGEIADITVQVVDGE